MEENFRAKQYHSSSSHDHTTATTTAITTNTTIPENKFIKKTTLDGYGKAEPTTNNNNMFSSFSTLLSKMWTRNSNNNNNNNNNNNANNNSMNSNNTTTKTNSHTHTHLNPSTNINMHLNSTTTNTLINSNPSAAESYTSSRITRFIYTLLSPSCLLFVIGVLLTASLICNSVYTIDRINLSFFKACHPHFYALQGKYGFIDPNYKAFSYLSSHSSSSSEEEKERKERKEEEDGSFSTFNKAQALTIAAATPRLLIKPLPQTLEDSTNKDYCMPWSNFRLAGVGPAEMDPYSPLAAGENGYHALQWAGALTILSCLLAFGASIISFCHLVTPTSILYLRLTLLAVFIQCGISVIYIAIRLDTTPWLYLGSHIDLSNSFFLNCTALGVSLIGLLFAVYSWILGVPASSASHFFIPLYIRGMKRKHIGIAIITLVMICGIVYYWEVLLGSFFSSSSSSSSPSSSSSSSSLSWSSSAYSRNFEAGDRSAPNSESPSSSSSSSSTSSPSSSSFSSASSSSSSLSSLPSMILSWFSLQSSSIWPWLTRSSSQYLHTVNDLDELQLNTTKAPLNHPAFCRVASVGHIINHRPSALCTSRGHLKNGGCKPVMKCDSSLSVTYSPLPTHYTQADLDKVDVFVASGQDADAIYWPPRDPTRQLRAVLSWEPFFFFPLTGALYRKDRAIDEWDLTFGFSPYWNDKAISMFPPDVDSVLLTPPWPKSKKTGFVAFFASNPVTQNKRTEYVAKMMTTIHIDSFGDVLHTADVPAEFNQGDYSARFQAKIEFCRRYRFVLAFENSNEPHYITEKIFNVLEAGAIPVYMGAPNIYDYWPIKSSIINANDFSSPEALAKFLVHVDSNATLYDSYFKWKTEPLPDIVYEHAKTSTHWNLCRACRVWGNTFPDIARTTNPKDVGVSSWGI